MKKILLLSDIHSNIEALEQLKNTKYWLDDETEIWFAGDYIDGYNQSPFSGLKVIQFVKETVLSGKGKAILGNHDEFLTQTFKEDYNAFSIWKMNGGRRTLNQSFGISDGRLQEIIYHLEKDYGDEIKFLSTLPLYLEEGNIISVHAGVNLEVPLYKQYKDDLLWIREPYYQYNTQLNNINNDFKGKTIVSGHTPTSYLIRNQDNNIIKEKNDNNCSRYYIDGGSKGNSVDDVSKINCLVLSLDGTEIDAFQLKSNGEIVNTKPILARLA